MTPSPERPAPGPCAPCRLFIEGAERWRLLATPGTRYRYAISNLGRIRNATTGKLLKIGKHSDGYAQVHLGGAYRNLLVHRLVALAWLGPAPADGRAWEVDHLDHRRRHNIAVNLRWSPKNINAWRWKYWTEEPPPDEEPVEETAEQVAAWLAEVRRNGWPDPPRPLPADTHRHLGATG